MRDTLPQVAGSFGLTVSAALRVCSGARRSSAPSSKCARPPITASASLELVEPGDRIDVVGLHRRQLVRLQEFFFLIRRQLDVHELAGHRLAQTAKQGFEQDERFGLVLVERIALTVGAEADHLAQMLQRDEMLAPQVIERLQQHHLFDLAEQFRPDLGGLRAAFSSTALMSRSSISSSAMPSSSAQSLIGRSSPKMLVDRLGQPFGVPLFGIGLLGDVLGDQFARRPDGADPATVSETSSLAHDVETLLEDDLALVVHHVVVLEDLLADIEVARLDLLLRHLQRLVHPAVRDRLAFLQAERLQNAVHLVGAEDAHQVVVEREIELRAARVALAAGAAAQLVVDAPAFVALGRDHVEAAGFERLPLLLRDVGLDLVALLRDRRLRRARGPGASASSIQSRSWNSTLPPS